jgi:AraC-like DNA-binding protein
MTRLASPAADAVSDTLRALSVRSSIFCLSELRAPWAFRVDGEDVAKFHLLLEGSARLEPEGSDPIAVGAGDVVLLPHGGAHVIGDAAGSPAVSLSQLLRERPLDDGRRLRYGGDGAASRLLCGGFTVADGQPEGTLALLPDVLRVDAESVAAAAWLEPVLAALKAEAEEGHPGAGAIVTKLADVFLAQILRWWLVGADRDGLPAGAFEDQPVLKALQALRARPSEHWTLELLAAHVGLSRTALATRFRRLVGMSPMRYLTKLRLGLAADELATGRRSIYEIARLTAYRNDATFSKAFKREFGEAPGAYRRNSRRPPEIDAV